MQKKGEIPVIIQVSRISESFKDRCFAEIKGVSVIDYLIQRILSNYSGYIMLATSNQEDDDIFDKVAERYNIGIFRGDYKNVVSRILGAAEQLNTNHIIRIYATYPFVDIEQLKKLEIEHLRGNYEYSYNEHSNGVIWGTGCEIFKTSFLKTLSNMKLKESQQETIGFYIRQNSKSYRILRYFIMKNRPNYKVCLESNKDLELLNDIAEHLEHVTNEKLIDYLHRHKILGTYNRDVIPAKEVGIEKLFLHSNKLMQIMESNGVDMSYPISVELSLTNACNLNCIYCSDKELRSRQGDTMQLNKEVLFKLFDDLAAGGTKGVVIEGGGEPTIYPHFSDIVKYAKMAGLAVGLITNGTQILSEEILQQFEWIRVSLDATTEKEYQSLKGNNYFEKVMVNIADYAKICDSVGVGFVVTKNNISQIETLVMRLRELHVSYVQFRPVVDCEELYPKGVELDYLKCYETMGFAVEIEGMLDNALGGNSDLPCIAHSLTSVISADGSVYMCGRLNIYDWFTPIGNIKEKSFHDVWFSEERKKQAELVTDVNFCNKNCPQCRITKFNKLLYRLEKTKSKHFI